VPDAAFFTAEYCKCLKSIAFEIAFRGNPGCHEVKVRVPQEIFLIV